MSEEDNEKKAEETGHVFMSRVPIVLEDYSDEHRPHNQEQVHGICIDPDLRPGFEMTGYNDRDSEEISDWWGRPYIVTRHWDAVAAEMESYREHIRRSRSQNTALLEQLDRAKQKARADWYTVYPSGFRYEVHCLDGQHVDRPSLWGMEATLRAAVLRAKQGPAWETADNEKDEGTSIIATDTDVAAAYWCRRLRRIDEISDGEFRHFKQ